MIELMVALVIGMLVSLAVFGVLSTFEGRKRTLTAGNDIEQAGQIAMYKIDNWVRSAGAGLSQAYSFAYGCTLYASKAGTQLLPRSAALSSPFASVGLTYRLAPIMILPNQTTPGASGQTSDVLAVMAAATSAGTYTVFSKAPSSTALNLVNSVDYGGSDLVLVGDQQPDSSGNIGPCMVQQVASSFSGGSATAVSLSGDYYSATISTTSLSSYTDSGYAVRLGNVTQSSPPTFVLIGVGDNDVLYSYDLLSTSDNPLQALADGVFEMHALYGVDTDDDGKIDAWVSPSTGSYALSNLTAGTPTAAKLLRRIKAVRVGLITRTSLPEKDAVTPGPLTLFSDVSGLGFSRTLSSTEQHYRYRTIDTIVPVRNNMF